MQTIYVTIILSLLTVLTPCAAESLNGFDLNGALIPAQEIRRGGPPKDGIPAITDPPILTAEKASYLLDSDLVIGVVLNRKQRAYPLRILIWHENANDTLGGVPIAVSYCPLCNSALVFDRRVGGQVREFGISGLLWNSNVLLYDRQPDPRQESLWNQVLMRAVTGPAARKKLGLKLLPSELMTWRAWRKKYPQTTVISNDTGFRRNYSGSPYASYFEHDETMFPVKLKRKKPKRYRMKEEMILVQFKGRLKAYALRDLARAKDQNGIVSDRLNGERIRLEYLSESKSAVVHAPGSPSAQPGVAYLYWFALHAILPEVELYEP